MTFFFALDLDDFKCSLTIPKFTNEGNFLKNISLFSSKIDKNCWLIKKQECAEDQNFFYLKVPSKEVDNIFFLSNQNQFIDNDQIRVKELRSFYKINSTLSFRANLNICNQNKENTSYQSEYPSEMINKTGSILTPVSSLINEGQNNFIAFKQIYYLPVKKSFLVYLIDVLSNKIVLKETFYTNSTNIINLTNIKNLKNCCFYSDGFLGIPIFISYGNNKGISMEHSHPPQVYLLSQDRFHVISNLKNRIKEIVSK